MQRDEDRLRMHIAPILDEYSQDVMHILEQDTTNTVIQAVGISVFPTNRSSVSSARLKPGFLP
jgi:hypothetical protein